MSDTSRQTPRGGLPKRSTSRVLLPSSSRASADREDPSRKGDAMEEPDRAIIGRISALLAGARLGSRMALQEGTGARGEDVPLELHDEAGTIHFTLSHSMLAVLFEGTSWFRAMAGQFSGTLTPTGAVGVSRYALEYSDPECCASYMSFTTDDRTGAILSIEPPEIDQRDLFVLPAPADTATRQLAEDTHRLKKI